MRIAITILVLLASSNAIAAPFCAVFSFGRQCYYYDAQSCREAAGLQGACVVNQNEVAIPAGGAPFCVVQSSGAQCYYYDAQSCREAASTSGGMCVVNVR